MNSLTELKYYSESVKASHFGLLSDFRVGLCYSSHAGIALPDMVVEVVVVFLIVKK